MVTEILFYTFATNFYRLSGGGGQKQVYGNSKICWYRGTDHLSSENGFSPPVLYGQSSRAHFCLFVSHSSIHSFNTDADTQMGLYGENGGSACRCWPTWKLMLLVPNCLPLNCFWFSSSSDYPHYGYNATFLILLFSMCYWIFGIFHGLWSTQGNSSSLD